MLLNLPSDILLTIANLSSDEIFTPPRVADYMLDMLPQNLFESPDTKFLDPACKSGIFLREIAKRLINGLKDKIPDLNTRLNHIFANQLYGIAITELTALMARRTLYCSKDAGGKYSVVSSAFENSSGNIRFELFTKHKFEKGKCVYCGAAEKNYNRDENLESHAYEFIHRKFWGRIYEGMKFDVIISNPPYQINTSDKSIQAKPIYQHFVEQAMKLNPKYISMIIPSRWFNGGIGMDKFRKTMLSDRRLKKIVDFPNSKECFGEVSISGGVCYFLWDRDYDGDCEITNVKDGQKTTQVRSLSEREEFFVRYNQAVSIIEKVERLEEEALSSLVSPLSPFGISTKVRGKDARTDDSDIKIYHSAGYGYISRDEITKGEEYLKGYKVLVSQTSAEHAGEYDKSGKYKVLTSTMRIVMPNEACTHSYLLIGPFDNKHNAQNVIAYLSTKFARFLMLQLMSSIHISRDTFSFVPVQDFNKSWTDEELYAKYKLEPDEIDFIESMIKPMELK